MSVSACLVPADAHELRAEVQDVSVLHNIHAVLDVVANIEIESTF
jgi:hypothetical protein